MKETFIKIEDLDQYLTFNETGFSENHKNISAIIKNGNIVRINDVDTFASFLNSSYDDNKIEKYLISRKQYHDLLIDLYIEMKTNDITDVELISRILKLQIFECKVLLPIYYVNLFEDQLEIGDFLFIKYQNISKYSYGIMPNVNKDFLTNMSDNYFNDLPFLVIDVNTRDVDYASEQAKIKLEEFIRFLNYVFYSNRRIDEPFSSASNFGTSECQYIFSEEFAQIYKSGHSPRIKRPVLSDMKDFLLSEENGNRKLIELFAHGGNNEVEKRVINAVNWIGMAVAEKNNSIAFTQAIFAIESLLQYEKSEPINKSIVANISEQIAFLLGRNFDERKNFEKDFKKMYGIRSKIAHGKGADITTQDVLYVIALAKSLICEILVNPEIKDAKTMTMISNFIEKKRYTVNDEYNSKT